MSAWTEACAQAEAEGEEDYHQSVYDRCERLDGAMVELERFRKQGATPRIHGNGFIQVDLTTKVRMHFWGPTIPRQKVPTPIHDHTFGFESHCIAGNLVNILYNTTPAARGHETHRVYRAQIRKGEDTILVPDEGRGVLLQPSYAHVIPWGARYQMIPGDIHQSLGDVPAITVIKKDNLTLAQGGSSPRIFVPVGAQPDNSFHRDAFPTEFLWAWINSTFGSFCRLTGRV